MRYLLHLEASKVKPRVLLDLDGVLCDFTKGAAKLHSKDVGAITCFDIAKCWNLTPKQLWSPLGYDFWANLDPTPEAYTIMNLCIKYVGWDTIGFLTSPCETSGCAEGKRTWLKKYFPAFYRNCLVGQAKHLCANPWSLLVDDRDENILDFHRAGGNVFLFPRPWNKHKKREGEALQWLEKALKQFTERW